MTITNPSWEFIYSFTPKDQLLSLILKEYAIFICLGHLTLTYFCIISV